MKVAAIVLIFPIAGMVQGDIVQLKSNDKIVAVGKDGNDDGTTIHLKNCKGKPLEYSSAEYRLNPGESDCTPVVENRLPTQLGIAKTQYDATWRVSDVKRFSNYFSRPVAGRPVQVNVEDDNIILKYQGETVKIGR